MNRRKTLLPIVGLFIVVQSIINIFGARIEAAGVDRNVLSVGNIFVFLITIVSLIVIMKGISQVKTLSFIRSINVAFIVKFFLVIAAVAIYAMVAKEIDRTAIMVSMGLYLVYTFLEVRTLLTHMKRKPDGEKGSPD